MKLPRLKVELTIPELSAFVRLRGAFYADVLERLPTAMYERLGALGGSGALRERWREALRKASESGYTGEDGQLVALGAVLLEEVKEVRAALLSAMQQEYESASKADVVMNAVTSERSG